MGDQDLNRNLGNRPQRDIQEDMDFKALLGKEIAKKKQLVSKVASTKTSDTAPAPAKKYISQAELRRAEELALLEKQKAVDATRAAKAESLKREREEEEQRELAKRTKREEKKQREKLEQIEEARRLEQIKLVEGLKENELTDEEIKKELRELGEPVVLFAETPVLRVVRLNAIHKKMEEDERDRLEDKIENEVEMEIKEDDIKEDPEKVYRQMRATLRTLLSEWESTIATTEDTTDESLEVLQQTKAYLIPLLKSLRARTLTDSLYPKLALLLHYVQTHQYRLAQDVYIKMSIGNATWPIGVTAVGIHARSSRERITGYETEKKGVDVAHIMADEDTRKWLIAVKRLMTFAEGYLAKKSFKN